MQKGKLCNARLRKLQGQLDVFLGCSGSGSSAVVLWGWTLSHGEQVTAAPSRSAEGKQHWTPRETTGFALGTLFLMLPVVTSSGLYQWGPWSSLASNRHFVLLSCHWALKLLLTITLSTGTQPLFAASLLRVIMSFSPFPWQAVWMPSVPPEWQHCAVHAVYQSVTCD